MVRRRDTLLAFGTLAAGAGAVVATGAFEGEGTSRNVTVAFADDDDAVLAMAPGTADRSHVSVEKDDDGVIAIAIERTNANARTIISELVTFTNNSSQTIRDITFGIDDRSEAAEVTVHGDMEGVGLAPGQSATGLGIGVDTRNYVGEPKIKGSITVRTTTEFEGS